MKKLLSLLAVAAIVTSAFAFTTKAKGTPFCISKVHQFNTQCKILNLYKAGTTINSFYDQLWQPGQPCLPNVCPNPIIVDAQ